MSEDIKFSAEKFVDYLSPILGEMGTEVLQLESPRCSDLDGFGYLAKSRRCAYKHGETCPEWDEQSVFETMAEDLKREVESKNKQKRVGDIELNTERLGIYWIWLQHDTWDDESIEKNKWPKEYKHTLMICIRYAFGKHENS